MLKNPITTAPWKSELGGGNSQSGTDPSELWQLILKFFCFLSHEMSQMAPGEQQAGEFSAHLSLFFSLRASSFDDKGRADDSRPPLFPESRRQRAFRRTRVRGPTQPARHPVAKGTAAVSAATEIVGERSNSLPVRNLCWVKLLDRKIKREEGIERKEEGGKKTHTKRRKGDELWWEEAGRRRRKKSAAAFSPFSAETVSGAAPKQQREKSMMNN